MARVYWVRSFVPTEKKSTSAANCAAITATDGTSTMIPTGTGATPRAARSSSKIALASRKSSMVAIIGNITLIFAPASTARRIARTWVRRISGRSRPTRMPRIPRKGFSSGAIGR